MSFLYHHHRNHSDQRRRLPIRLFRHSNAWKTQLWKLSLGQLKPYRDLHDHTHRVVNGSRQVRYSLWSIFHGKSNSSGLLFINRFCKVLCYSSFVIWAKTFFILGIGSCCIIYEHTVPKTASFKPIKNWHIFYSFLSSVMVGSNPSSLSPVGNWV